MPMISTAIHSLPIVVGIALVSLSLGKHYPLLTGVALILAGALVK
jgi:hypothetical protein